MSAGTRALTSAKHRLQTAREKMSLATSDEARSKAKSDMRREAFTLAAVKEKLRRERNHESTL